MEILEWVKFAWVVGTPESDPPSLPPSGKWLVGAQTDLAVFLIPPYEGNQHGSAGWYAKDGVEFRLGDKIKMQWLGGYRRVIALPSDATCIPERSVWDNSMAGYNW